MNFENHPFIPEQSEDHEKLIIDLAEWKNRLGDPRVAPRVQRQDGGEALLALLERTRIGALGEVTVVAYRDDPDYSAERPPRHMDDAELGELNTRAAEVFVTAELHSDN